MTNTLATITAALLLALTVPGQAATPQDNLRAIERLAQRQQASIERAAVHAVHVDPEPQQKPDSTLQMTPQEIAYEEARPWMLLSKPVSGAYRVRGGWLIHEDEFRRRGHHGFYRARTDAEARQLRHSR